MSGTSLGSPNLSWALVAPLAQPRISVTSYCTSNRGWGQWLTQSHTKCCPGSKEQPPRAHADGSSPIVANFKTTGAATWDT